ncbi:MAG: hypothetical protein O7G32_14175, partial [SAR324 cluster bacterium]|nr:hypothetical protein [SAR324 cluster bacterium]
MGNQKYNTSILSESIPARMADAVRYSWKLFISHYATGKYEISKEASFQLQLARLIATVGELHCFSNKERAQVDRELDIEERQPIDIVFKIFSEDAVSMVPIELKFKTKQQGAQDIGSMDIFRDIFRLENIKKTHGHCANAFFF